MPGKHEKTLGHDRTGGADASYPNGGRTARRSKICFGGFTFRVSPGFSPPCSMISDENAAGDRSWFSPSGTDLR
jgi:hypothetical protein